jgi:hypothetical protein
MKNSSVTKIGKNDVTWNYLATFLQIGSGLLLFPLILKLLPSETVGVWSVFIAISSMVGLLDFGFSPSFTRNITYIFSGVNKLEKTGISTNDINAHINFELFGNTIKAMKWLYSRIALIAFFLLITAGSYYVYHITNSKYYGDKTQIYTAWIIFCLINTYNIYTLYYDSLLMGAGLVMKDKQLIIISQLAYLVVSVSLILSGFGLIGIVSAQAVSVIIKRVLSYKYFFSTELKNELKQVDTSKYMDIVKVLTPNSVKLGLTSIGAFLVLQSSVIIGSIYLSLNQLASYGITIQAINLIGSLSMVYYSSFTPLIAHLRVERNLISIKRIYIKCIFVMAITFLVCGIGLILAGNWALILLKSQTFFLNKFMLLAILIIALLEKNHALAGGFLLSRNEVPYFKAAIISGIATVLLLFLFIRFERWGVWGMILAPGIVQLVYQNWKWPLVLIKELKLKN